MDNLLIVDGRDLGITLIEDELIDTYLPQIKAEGLALYVVLARLVKRDKPGTTHSQTEIGGWFGWTRDTARKWLEVLEGAGLLTSERRYQQNIEIAKAYQLLSVRKNHAPPQVQPGDEKLRTEDDDDIEDDDPNERPHIYTLYETVLGLMVRSLYEADYLKDVEETYPRDWIEAAFKMAVDKGATSRLAYAVKILEDWRERGRDAPKKQEEYKPFDAHRTVYR